MFEQRLKDISKDLRGKNLKRYFILTHKKHKREMYIESGNKKALDFVKPKFDSARKKFIYLLLQLRLLQIFLKKIFLQKEFGNVILIGEQIKGFNFEDKTVISFPLRKNQQSYFNESKKFQDRISKKGFAPKISLSNKKIPVSKEELCEIFKSKNYRGAFQKLNNFYRLYSWKKIPVKKYIAFAKKELGKQEVKEKLLLKELEKIGKKNFDVITCLLHGDFSAEQILMKNKNYLFVDWHPYKGVITNDLVNFFRETDNILNNSVLKEILTTYPKIVQENINAYVILSEISLLINKKRVKEKTIKRIKAHLKGMN